MAVAWFVRVADKEYGPVDLPTLHEWKAEGRLIPTNELRRDGDSAWVPAADIGDLFDDHAVVVAEADTLFRRRSLGQIVAETFRIYGRGFPQFLALALMVAVPSLGLKISLAYVNFREGEALSPTARMAAVIAMIMLVGVVVSWPIFVAGLQFGAADAAAGRPLHLRNLLRRSIALWPRLARLSLFVYGSYLFWTLLPVVAIIALASSATVLSLLIALLALAFQVYMAGRLFINFMFWQQACTIGDHDGIEALRESRELARSRTSEPRWQRPLYRGAIIASVWLLVLLAVSAAVELPFVFVRIQSIRSLEELLALTQQMANAPAPDLMTLGTYVVSSLVHAALRPLLGIAFVVLYFDARAK